LAESPAYICPDCTTQSDQESEDEEEQVQIIQEFSSSKISIRELEKIVVFNISVLL
jgi:hypothetical protein